jgi:hypothetical protein
MVAGTVKFIFLFILGNHDLNHGGMKAFSPPGLRAPEADLAVGAVRCIQPQ